MSKGNTQQAQLVFIVRRIEAIDEEIAEKKEERASEFDSARAAGFVLKVIRQMLKERKMDPDALEGFLTACEIYRTTLGMANGRALSPQARRQFFPAPPSSESRTEDEKAT